MTTTPKQKQNAPSAIQHTSSPSVSVFWLNLEQVKSRLNQAVKNLAKKQAEIEEVWLFGSLARGEALPGSDADLLMVLSDSQAPFLDRPAHYQLDFYDIGLDLLIYTRAEIAQMQAEGNTFLRQAQMEGVCLYRRSLKTPGV